jgi:hypothetical protein
MLEKRLVVLTEPMTLGFGRDDVIPRSNSSNSPPEESKPTLPESFYGKFFECRHVVKSW